MLSTILIIILILLLIGALPTWPYSSGWGYYPGGTLGLILLIIIILALIGRIEQALLQSSLSFAPSFKRNRWPKHRMTRKPSGHRGFFPPASAGRWRAFLRGRAGAPRLRENS